MHERLSLDAAATRLGMSVHTLRRRVRAGELRAEREPVRGGFRYVVILDAHPRPDDRASEPPPTMAITDAVLTQITSERDHLRRLVHEQQGTIDRLTVLLKQSQDQSRLLAEPVQVSTHEHMHQATHEITHEGSLPRRPSWWRRLLMFAEPL